jgi:hypothetical protein
LPTSRTPATQGALLALLREPQVPTSLNGHALIDIAFITRPEPEVALSLIALLPVRELAPSVLITLGSVSRRLRDAGRTEEVEVIRPSLARALAEAKDQRSRADAMRRFRMPGTRRCCP